MEPIKLELTLNLDKHLQAGYRQVGEDDYVAEPATLESLVIQEAARQLLAQAATSSDTRKMLRQMTSQIAGETIRAKVEPIIEAAIDAGLQPTNSFGEPTGEPVTLRTLIMQTAEKQLRHVPKESRSGYGREATTTVDKIIEETVKQAIASDLRTAVEEARTQVANAVRGQMASLVAEAVKRGLK